MQKLALIIFLIGVTRISIAQRINGFNLYPVSSGVNVNFNIGPGVDCYGYKIFHCLDSINYIEIYDFAGICGTSTSNELKSYTHQTAVLNQINYYKVQLYPYEVAYNKILYTNDGKGSVMAFPNPVSQDDGSINFRLSGVDNIRVEGYVCNEFGIKVQEIDDGTKADLLQIGIESFSDGIYIIWMTDGASIYTTKFIVLHTN